MRDEHNTPWPSHVVLRQGWEAEPTTYQRVGGIARDHSAASTGEGKLPLSGIAEDDLHKAEKKYLNAKKFREKIEKMRGSAAGNAARIFFGGKGDPDFGQLLDPLGELFRVSFDAGNNLGE